MICTFILQTQNLVFLFSNFFLIKKNSMFAFDMKCSHLIFHYFFLNSYMKALIFFCHLESIVVEQTASDRLYGRS